MITDARISALALILLSLAGCGRSGMKDLVMLSVDTLRRDAVGRWAGGNETPSLDAWLEGALVLEAHHACSNWTYGAVACGLSGADGVDLGWVPVGGEALPQGLALLPGVLRDQGYRAALVSTNGFVGAGSGLSRYYDDVTDASRAPADEVVDAGLAALERVEGGGPWMLHLHLYDPHAPYDPPGEYLEGLEGLEPVAYDLSLMSEVERLKAGWGGLSPEEQALTLAHLRVRYAGSVRFLDDQLARLLEALEDRGALEEALVVFWSDHGEQLFEFGELTHGYTLHEVEVGVPAAFRAPWIAPGARSSPTTHADLAPAALDWLGLDPALLSGVPLADQPVDRPLFAVRRGDGQVHTLQSVDQGGWRLIYDWEGELGLYDLAADPGEQDNRYAADDPTARALWDLLLPRVEALAAMRSDDSPVLE